MDGLVRAGIVAVDRDGIRWPRYMGALSALAGLTFVLLGLFQRSWSPGPWQIVGAVVVVGVFTADALRFIPRWLLGIVATVGALLIANTGSNIAIFLVVMTCGEVAATGTMTEAGVTLVVAIVGISVRMLGLGFGAYGGPFWPAGAAFATSGGYGMRTLLRLNAELKAAQTTIADQAAADERRRLAREIHDVVAHSMTVSMLHITAARLALQDAPPSVDEALDALNEAETQGRLSLADIRHTVGLLATGAPGDSQLAAPLPDAGEIESLVASMGEAGVSVDYTVRGDPTRLSPATSLALYRVAQEGLANAAKHAPGAPIKVLLDVHRRHAALCITNGRAAGAPLVDAGGNGVIGMTERVNQLGGRLRAGPQDEGWRVTADVPVAAPSSRGEC